jgi:hypothetical protein
VLTDFVGLYQQKKCDQWHFPIAEWERALLSAPRIQIGLSVKPT